MNLLGDVKTSGLEALGPDVVDGVMSSNAGGATGTHDCVVTPDVKGRGTLGLGTLVWQQDWQPQPPTQQSDELLLVKLKTQLLNRESCKPRANMGPGNCCQTKIVAWGVGNRKQFRLVSLVDQGRKLGLWVHLLERKVAGEVKNRAR